MNLFATLYTDDDVEQAARDLAFLIEQHAEETDPEARAMLADWIDITRRDVLALRDAVAQARGNGAATGAGAEVGGGAMSKTPWTPGPWWVQKDGITVCPPKPRGQSIICRAAETYMDRAQREANARLIAAAPEMATIIHELLATHVAHHNHPAHVVARALLARIRGETT